MNKYTPRAHRQQIETELREMFSLRLKSIRTSVIRIESDAISSLSGYINLLLLNEIPSLSLVGQYDYKIGTKRYTLRVRCDGPDNTILKVIVGPNINIWDEKKYNKKPITLFTSEIAESGLVKLVSAEIWVAKELEGLIDKLVELVWVHFRDRYQILLSKIRMLFLTKGHPWAILDHLLKEKLSNAGIGHLYPEIFLLEVNSKDVGYVMTVDKAKESLKTIANAKYESHSPLELLSFVLTHRTPIEETFASLTTQAKKGRMQHDLTTALYALSCPQMQIGELALLGEDFEQRIILIRGQKKLIMQYSDTHKDIMNNFLEYWEEEFSAECNEIVKGTFKKFLQNSWFKLKQKLYAIRESDVVYGIFKALGIAKTGHDL